LERIKQERVVAQAKRELEEKELEEKLKKDNAMKSDPLLHIDELSAKVNTIFNKALRYCLPFID
jgi:hypothetical protein